MVFMPIPQVELNSLTMASLLNSPLGQLRIVGFLEGLSFLLLLLFAMPMKYMAGQPEFVRVIGMAHGILFILYIPAVFRVALADEWGKSKTALAMLASLIPCGTFWAEFRLFRPRNS